jgi:(p)ppGpp synthase/HD superfamily hydrolase
MTAEDLYNLALRIAIRAHEGQKDKGGRDYVTHPIRVASRCKGLQAKTVALLHDTLEDTSVTVDELRGQGFPEEIIEAVEAVTKRKGERYEAFIERLAGNPLAREVKMADLEDNMDIRRLEEITDRDVTRLRTYLRAWKFLSNCR